MRRPEEHQVTDDRLPAITVATEQLCASVFVGEHSYVLELAERGSLTLGRSPDASVQLVAQGVSRTHARIESAGGRATVEDLGSRNGTLVNHAPISAKTAVATGDEIGIGAARLVLLRRTSLAAGSVCVLAAEDFAARIEALGRPFSLVAIRLEHRWYELGAARAWVASASGHGFVGNYNDFVLVMATEAEPSAFAAAAAKLLEASIANAHASVLVASGSSPAASLRDVLGRLSQPETAPVRNDEVICVDPKMAELAARARRVARSSTSVLVVGETGAGKEVFARLIHAESGRSGRLVSVNMAALPEQLLESELFGHERGAFSGAVQAKVGLIEAAHGGTLFLDEIGELPLSMQAKLLRVLEDHVVRRIGGTTEKKIDIRVVAATNDDLEQSVTDKRFRSDLFYRLNACMLRIPPLRDRPAEISHFAHMFLARGSAEVPTTMPQETLAVLERYRWPGNVRELKNVIEGAIAIAHGVIKPEHLPERLLAKEDEAPPPSSTSAGPAVREDVRDFERDRIARALEQANGNQTRAAELLGLPRRTLAYKMARLGLRPPRT